jgi:hypothetical protein
MRKGFGPKGGTEPMTFGCIKEARRCHHFWMRKVFMAKEGAKSVDAKSPNAETSVSIGKESGSRA